jgi:predicted TPR repeat methyltransferase
VKQAPLVRSSMLALAAAQDGYHAFDIASRTLHWLNPTAALIIELCDGSRTQSEIIILLDQLQESTDDSNSWIQQALESGWLKPIDGENVDEYPSAHIVATLAWDLREEGDYLASYVCQEYAVELQPEVASHWRYLGEISHITGQRERALEAYEKYLTLNPDDAEILLIVVALRDEPPPRRAPDAYIRQLYTRFASFYEDNMRDELGYNGPERVASLLDQYLDGVCDLNILDMGCGTGLSGQPLKPHAKSLTGIDLSAEMLEQAETSGLYDRLECAEITEWLANNKDFFDLIVACDTCIYFGDLGQIISPANQHIVPGGWMIVSVEKGDSYPYCLADSGRYSHTQRHIEEVAKDVGLEILDVDEGFLRDEYSKPVIALMVLMRKPLPV